MTSWRCLGQPFCSVVFSRAISFRSFLLGFSAVVQAPSFHRSFFDKKNSISKRSTTEVFLWHSFQQHLCTVFFRYALRFTFCSMAFSAPFWATLLYGRFCDQQYDRFPCDQSFLELFMPTFENELLYEPIFQHGSFNAVLSKFFQT